MDWIDGHDQFIGQLMEDKKMTRYEFFAVEKQTLIVGIEANSKEEAEEQMQQMLDDNDLEWGFADVEIYSEYNGEQ
jgi:hypothetical protein